MPSRALAFLLAALVMFGLSLVPGPLAAERSYTVRAGDTLARIARRHRVTVDTLRAANRLGPRDALRPGQRLTIPDRGVIFVAPGDTLSTIARRHDVTTDALRRANRLRGDRLQAGQRLMLPGFAPASARRAAERRWGEPRHPGVVELVRMQSGQRLRMRFVDRRGRVRSAAMERLSPLMQGRERNRRLRPHRRLLAMLANVSDHFGGRTLYVVSGFRAARGYTRATSKHTMGRAIDFRVRGVPNTALRDYCRGLSQAGVGYYPRSSFVHLDARERRTYWVDWSRPGERPDYRRPGEAPEDEADSAPSPQPESDAPPASGDAPAATASEPTS
ncbi:MAG: LysM peptidoglycan-binding domain-containing protein [Myxococcota bacterium]